MLKIELRLKEHHGVKIPSTTKNIDTYPKLQILNPFKVHSADEWNHNVKVISPVCCFVLWFFSLELLNDAHEPPVCCFVLWFLVFRVID